MGYTRSVGGTHREIAGGAARGLLSAHLAAAGRRCLGGRAPDRPARRPINRHWRERRAAPGDAKKWERRMPIPRGSSLGRAQAGQTSRAARIFSPAGPVGAGLMAAMVRQATFAGPLKRRAERGLGGTRRPCRLAVNPPLHVNRKESEMERSARWSLLRPRKCGGCSAGSPFTSPGNVACACGPANLEVSGHAWPRFPSVIVAPAECQALLLATTI